MDKAKTAAKPSTKVEAEVVAPLELDLKGELEFKLRQAELTLKEYASTPEGKHKGGWLERILADIHGAIGKVRSL